MTTTLIARNKNWHATLFVVCQFLQWLNHEGFLIKFHTFEAAKPEILSQKSCFETVCLWTRYYYLVTNYRTGSISYSWWWSQEANITRMYVYVPVLKKLILVSVAWVISQYFYPSLDGMLDLHKGTPPPPHPLLNIKFAGTHVFIHVGGERHCESN